LDDIGVDTDLIVGYVYSLGVQARFPTRGAGIGVSVGFERFVTFEVER
jgi:hypothetical protein